MKKQLALALCAALMLGTVSVSAETEAAESTEYLYGYTQMSYADFWYGEIENPAACDTFDTENPDLTATSEEYLHYSYSSADDADPYAGVQKNTWDNDSGMYDVVSRATVGYGLFRASFANVVEVKEDDGSKYVFNNEIVADENAPTGYSLNVNTNEVPGIVLGSNTRLDTDNSTGYTPDTNTVYTESVAGYQIVGLKSVPVKVKKSTVEAAQALTEAGTANAQLDAFMAQYEKITFVDESEMTSYACKELYANGVYSAREVNANAQVKSAGTAYLGTGANGTKPMAHGDGYADLTMYVYLDAFDGYTKGSVASLDEETLNTLYEGEEKATYAENKEAGDKLAGFMDYALHFQGAKLQWAGADGVFDTEDDVFAGNMLHKDCYFSFNHGNYIEVSITNSFERFANLGNGDYRITLISEGYADVTVEADSLVLDYKTPTVAEDDVPALADGETEMKVQLSTEGVKVSNDESVTASYLAGLENVASYTLSYTQGSGRKAETVVLCESASAVENNDGVLTVSFDVSGKELPTDIHYTVTIASDVASEVAVEFHYAPAE